MAFDTEIIIFFAVNIVVIPKLVKILLHNSLTSTMRKLTETNGTPSVKDTTNIPQQRLVIHIFEKRKLFGKVS